MSRSREHSAHDRGLVVSSDRVLTLPEFTGWSRRASSVVVHPDTLNRMDAAHLAAKTNTSGPIYGVSTGFGPMVTTAVEATDCTAMQYNLVRSHAAGLGGPVPQHIVRGMLLARLQSLTRNHSAVPGALASHLADLLSLDLLPVVPRKGGVGASGDLVQLAHLALTVIGEGTCTLRGELLGAGEAYVRVGLSPYELTFRDGLALVNGTSAMVSAAAFACVEARRLFDLALELSGTLAAVLEVNREAFEPNVHEAKLHATQSIAAGRILQQLGTGDATISRDDLSSLQAPYSIRCAPQIVGPMLSACAYAERAVEDELNSASDNPVFDPITGAAYHGGNFHGEAVAQAMDVLKIAVVKCGLLMDRQLDLLLDDRANGVLPPFLNRGSPGVYLGLQGVQFTSTSTAAELQSLAFPMSLHTIPSNKGNQDVVSMGFNAAMLASQCLEGAFDIAAILAVALAEATEVRGCTDRLPPAAERLVSLVRGHVRPLITDRSLSGELQTLSQSLRNSELDC